MRAKKVSTEVRRGQIAEAALVLVGRGGWRAFSLEALADEVGVVPSAIYRHYAGKGAVLDAVLRLISRRLAENVLSARREAVGSVERLRVLLERHMRMVCESRGIPRVIFSEEVIGGDRARRARLHALLRAYLGRVSEILREGQATGRVRRDIRPGTLAVMFLGLVQPATMLHLTSDGRFDAMGFQREAWVAFEGMLVTKDRAAGRRRQ